MTPRSAASGGVRGTWPRGARVPRCRRRGRGPLLTLLGALRLARGSSADVPSHARFEARDGVVRLIDRPELRLNAAGGNFSAGTPLVVWHCETHVHELFEPPTPEGLIRLSRVETEPAGGLCLRASGSLAPGRPIVTWPCPAAPADAAATQRFQYEPATGRLRAQARTELCIRAKGLGGGNLTAGSDLVLWPCGKTPALEERFGFEGGRIVLLANQSLHFNVANGMLKERVPIILWDCQPNSHELYEFSGGRLHLSANKALCVNAAGGLGPSRPLVLWPCAPVPEENELFEEDPALGAIVASRAPNLAFNAAGGALQPGDKVVLWPLDHDEL